MNRLAVLVGATLALTLAGCVTFERATYRMTYDSARKLGTYTMEFHNIQSDEPKADGQDRDYRQLIEDWTGDGYLLQRVRDGVYVKERHLDLREGVLVGGETGLFGELAAVDLERDSTGVTTWSEPNAEVLRTNGRVNADRNEVRWPAGTTRFELEARNRDFKAQSDFAARFKAREKR